MPESTPRSRWSPSTRVLGRKLEPTGPGKWRSQVSPLGTLQSRSDFQRMAPQVLQLRSGFVEASMTLPPVDGSYLWTRHAKPKFCWPCSPGRRPLFLWPHRVPALRVKQNPEVSSTMRMARSWLLQQTRGCNSLGTAEEQDQKIEEGRNWFQAFIRRFQECARRANLYILSAHSITHTQTNRVKFAFSGGMSG